MRTPDAVLQDVWRIKDQAYAQAGGNAERFVQLLRARSDELRRGLALKPLDLPSKAPLNSGALRKGQAD